MKKLTLLAVLLCSLKISAQNYLDFPPAGNEVTWLYTVQIQPYDGTFQYRYSNEDTVINGYSYKKISKSYLYYQHGGPGQIFTYTGYDLFSSYIRQSSDGIVYVKFSAQEDDRILFDLNIQEGDTVPQNWTLIDTSYTWYTDPVIVTGIDTVFDSQNISHRVYDFNLNAQFIEGIGCTYDFYRLLPSNPGAPFFTLHCVSNYGQQVFPFSGNADCTPLTNPNAISEDLNKPNEITVYPNPAIDFVIIQSTYFTDEETVLIATDINGKQIPLNYTALENKITCNISELPEGVYAVMVRVKEKLFVFKFIKHK